MRIIGNTNKGKIRKINQDYYTNRVINQSLGFSIVCDGMGGTGGGEIASKLATECMEKIIDESLIEENKTDDTKIKQIIISAILTANAEVFDYAKKNPKLKGMGTTTVVAVFNNDKIQIAYDGDSRFYKINIITKELTQITKDHTVVQFLMEQGEINREQAKNHPQKHYITRAIGVDEMIEADYIEIPFKDDEIYLICTDGLYNFMSDEEIIKEAIDSANIEDVRPLIDLANKNGGGDNITAVVITSHKIGGAI